MLGRDRVWGFLYDTRQGVNPYSDRVCACVCVDGGGRVWVNFNDTVFLLTELLMDNFINITKGIICVLIYLYNQIQNYWLPGKINRTAPITEM